MRGAEEQRMLLVSSGGRSSTQRDAQSREKDDTAGMLRSQVGARFIRYWSRWSGLN